MNSQQNEEKPPAQAGQSREAGRVAGQPSGGGSRETDWPEASPERGAQRGSAKHQLGVPSRSVDLWDSITHGERRGALVPMRRGEAQEVAMARRSEQRPKLTKSGSFKSRFIARQRPNLRGSPARQPP